MALYDYTILSYSYQMHLEIEFYLHCIICITNVKFQLNGDILRKPSGRRFSSVQIHKQQPQT